MQKWKLEADAEQQQAEAWKKVHANKHYLYSTGCSDRPRRQARVLHCLHTFLGEIPGRLMVGQRPLEP